MLAVLLCVASVSSLMGHHVVPRVGLLHAFFSVSLVLSGSLMNIVNMGVLCSGNINEVTSTLSA